MAMMQRKNTTLYSMFGK